MKNLDTLALAVLASLRLEKQGISIPGTTANLVRKHNLSKNYLEKLQERVHALKDESNIIFNAVDNMSDTEFNTFIERMMK